MNSEKSDENKALLRIQERQSIQAVKEKGQAFDDTSDDDGGLLESMSRHYHRARKHIIWYMGELSEDLTTSKTFVVTQEVLMWFQLLSFAFVTDVNFGWGPIMNVPTTVAMAVNKFPTYLDTPFSEYLTACVVIGFIAVVLTFSALTLVYLNWRWPIWPARTLLLLLPQSLFIPIMNALTKAITGCFYLGSDGNAHPFYPNLVCWRGSYITVACVSLILIGAYLWLCIIIIHSINDTTIPVNLNNQPFAAVVTARLEESSLYMISGTLVLINSLYGDKGRWPLPFVYILFGLYVAYLNYKYLPVYSDILQSIRIFRPLSLAWIGLCLVLTVALDEQPDSTGILFFGFLPIIPLLSPIIVRSRYSYITKLSSSELDEPFLFELRTRAILRRWLRAETWGISYTYFEDTPERTARKKAAFAEAEEMLQGGVQRFPESSFMHAYLAIFYFTVLENRVLAYAELKAAEDRNPRFDVKLMLLKYRRRLDIETEHSLSREVQTYMEFKTRKELAEASTVEASLSLVEFWTQLLRPAPDVDVLAQQGHLTRVAMSRANSHFTKLLAINPNSVQVLRAYATFALDIQGDIANAAEMFERADGIESQRQAEYASAVMQGDFNHRLDHNLDIFDERNAVIGISLNKESLGEIENVNVSARRLFGYQQVTDMVGKNISIIVPSPFAERHDYYLSEFLRRMTPRIMNQTRIVFALHKAGHVFPVNLYVRWADAANGKAVGVIQPITQSRDLFLLVEQNSFIVTHCTANCYGVFGILRRELANKEIKLHHLLPSLRDDNEELHVIQRRWEMLASRNGVTLDARHMVKQSLFRAHARSVSVALYDTTVVVVRVASLHDVSDSDSEMENEQDDLQEGDDFQVSPLHSTSTNADGRSFPGFGVSYGRNRLQFNRAGDNKYLLGQTPRARDGSNFELKDSFDHLDADQPRKGAVNKLRGEMRRHITDAHDIDPSIISGGTSNHSIKISTTQARLSKAIHNENKRTAKRLKLMSIFLMIILAVSALTAVCVHLVTEVYIGYQENHIERVYRSADRTARVQEVATGARMLGLISNSSAPYFYRADSNSTNFVDVSRAQINRIKTALGSYYNSKAFLDDVPSGMSHVSPEQYHFQTTPSVGLDLMYGEARAQFVYSMTNALNVFSSATNLMLYAADMNLQPNSVYFTQTLVETPWRTLLPTVEPQDPAAWEANVGLYVSVANGFKVLHESIIQDTTYTSTLLRDKSSELQSISFTLTVISVVGIIALLAILVRPIVLDIEVTKTDVLDMFLDIPRTTRRAIRRRVYGVYLSIRSDEDTVNVDDGDDQEDGMHSSAEDREFGTFVESALGDNTKVSTATRSGHKLTNEAGYQSGMKDIGAWLSRSKRQLTGDETSASNMLPRGSITQIASPHTQHQRLVDNRRGNDSKPHGLFSPGYPSISLGSDGEEDHRFVRGLENAIHSGTNVFGGTRRVQIGSKEDRRLRAKQAVLGTGALNQQEPMIRGAKGVGAANESTLGRSDIEMAPIKGSGSKASSTDGKKGESLAGAVGHGLHLEKDQKQSILQRRALQILALKVLGFILIVCAYFITVIVTLTSDLDKLNAAAETVKYSSLREGSFSRAYFSTREWLFFNRSLVEAATPIFATNIIEHYAQEAQLYLAEANRYHRGVVFGDPSLNLAVAPPDENQDRMLFMSACDISDDEDSARFITRRIPDYYVKTCRTFMDGVMNRGIHAALNYLSDMVATLTAPNLEGVYTRFVIPWIDSTITPFDSPIAKQVLAEFSLLERLANDYIPIALRRSTSYYIDQIMKTLEAGRNLRLYLLIGFLFALVLLYGLVFHPLITGLNTAARNTRAMMLVLPPDVVQNIPSVQAFILENYQRRD